jgi:putative ABC transport system permease protein
MANNASFAEAASVAVHSLRSSKLRSFLTLLGIILATTTLIAVMSLINGMDVYIARKVSDMGADGFRIERIIILDNFDPKKYLEMEKRNPQMTREEYGFIREHATLVREFGMNASRTAKAKAGNKAKDVDLTGVTPNIVTISNIDLAEGRFVSDMDDQRRQNVAIIGSEIKERFFENSDPIGKSIDIDGRPFEVIGVAKPRGSVFGQSQDLFAMIPIETYFKMYGFRKVGLGYNATAIDSTRLNEAMDEVRSLMRAYRHLKPGQEDTFGMAASDSLVSAWKNLTGAVAATAVAVVSVFMVVGGVVIMNIMLAVVTERTHEIGVRKAIGARRRDIMNQFLIESSMLAGIGGLIGVLSAWAVAQLVTQFTPVPMELPISAIVISVGVSALVGLFFGIYPARRAAMLDPIEALRYE